MKGYLIFICLIICGSLISGCTTSAPGSKDTTSIPQVTTSVSAGPTAIVEIRARSFDPSTITIKEGTSVTWKNEETIVRHVVHLPDVRQTQLFDSGPISPMESYTYTFSGKGWFNYGDPQIGGGRTYLVIVE